MAGPACLRPPMLLGSRGSAHMHNVFVRSGSVRLDFLRRVYSSSSSSSCRAPRVKESGCRYGYGYEDGLVFRSRFSGYNLSPLLNKVVLGRRYMSSGRPTSGNHEDKPEQQQPSSPPKKPRLISRLPIPKHENIYTIPNILTFSRLLAAPAIGFCILHSHHTVALSLFAYAAATDLVDGYIARKFNQQTVVGTVIDPMADKTLMTVGVVCLAMNSLIPIWLAGLILARDVGLAISAIYYRWVSLPPPKTMARYWDFSLPSAEVKPTTISKINTALQLFLIGSTVGLPVVPEAIVAAWSLNEGMVGLQYLVATTTVWSGLSYVYSKDAVKILGTKDQ